MDFEIRQLNWHKRRKPGKDIQPVSVEIPDFRKEVNYMCDVQVIFDNGDTMVMKGRVLQNPVTGAWSVNAINTSGQSVFARLVE